MGDGLNSWQNQVFTNNNEILKRELPLLLDDLTTELEIIIGDVYEDDLDTKVLYFDGGRIKNAKSGNVEKAVNECCLNVYTSTPIINNEMVNRAEIGTAQTKKARLNIVQAILSHTDTPEFYRGSNQEATIYRSLFCVTGIVDGDIREDIQLVIDEINRYIDSCCDKKVSVKGMVYKLVKAPYGMRAGVIPFYLAYVLANRREDIIVYFSNKEVDIFSEGVDVPEINQVIMLRPTESPIVFIQQLGRGLRKAENKEYVVVLDFIGNYRNNFMIPIALSGDRSYNKDNIRRYVTEGGRVIPGASTIHFDEISRKRIFQAIDNANFSDIKLIRENYTNLKNKLGHIPALADFDKYGEMDVLRIFDNNSLGSYYKFLVKYEKEYTIRLSEDEEKAIEFISKKLASGKRIHELELLKRTLQYHHGIIGRLRKHLSEKYQCEMDEHCTENVVNMMTNEFSMSAAKKTYAQCVFLKKEQDDYGISDVYGKMLQNPEFCAILEELVDFGISRYKVNYSYHYQDTNLVLYQKYTYEDACRLLNWERNEVPLNIGGYKYNKKTKTFPIFINYDKQDNISDTTKYEDHFVAENRLIAISKSGRSMDSEDVQNFLKATERGIDVQLFVRKNKDDKISKEFYYLGRVIATGNAKQFVIPNTDKTAVEIEWELETPVREDIYQYIVNE